MLPASKIPHLSPFFVHFRSFHQLRNFFTGGFPLLFTTSRASESSKFFSEARWYSSRVLYGKRGGGWLQLIVHSTRTIAVHPHFYPQFHILFNPPPESVYCAFSISLSRTLFYCILSFYTFAHQRQLSVAKLCLASKDICRLWKPWRILWAGHTHRCSILRGPSVSHWGTLLNLDHRVFQAGRTGECGYDSDRGKGGGGLIEGTTVRNHKRASWADVWCIGFSRIEFYHLEHKTGIMG